MYTTKPALLTLIITILGEIGNTKLASQFKGTHSQLLSDWRHLIFFNKVNQEQALI